MKDFISKIMENKIVAGVLAGLILLFVTSKKARRRVFGSKPKRRRRKKAAKVTRRAAPRKTARRNVKAKGYAAAGGGTIPLQFNKDGSVKKAWQVRGTVAARQRMQRLRKSR